MVMVVRCSCDAATGYWALHMLHARTRARASTSKTPSATSLLLLQLAAYTELGAPYVWELQHQQKCTPSPLLYLDAMIIEDKNDMYVALPVTAP
jgi:hypothetical protein